ncbi:ParM/StbA family protein [Brevibacillus centrosporus]|uniref:ParM/StbA family protein n=1 Tax=Brevibacillus centrosporus TaxID=54910 RepID=UPI003D1B9D45
MNQKFIIAVDSGKFATKAQMRDKDSLLRVKFRTKVQKISTGLGQEIFTSGNTYRVEYNGKQYLLGDMVSEEKSSYHLSKNSQEHIISIYVAICQLLSKSTHPIGFASVHLACNVPINIYKSEEQKLAYQDAIRNNGQPISISVNGKAFTFRIQEIVLLPEALGPLFERTAEYRTKRATIFDIGGLNTSILEANQLIPQFDQMTSSNHGINMLRSKIADFFSSKYGMTITENDAEQILRDKCLILNGKKQEESSEIIETMFSEHVRSIMNFVFSRNMTFTNSMLVFIGGGSLLLSDHIQQQFPSAMICEDPVFGNVRSYLKIGEAKWKSTSSQ